MKKLVVVTNLLPHYQIDFFNRLIEIDGSLKLTVFADIFVESSLNNYSKDLCKFDVVHSEMKSFSGVIFRSSIKNKIDEIDPDYLVFYGNPREFSLSLLMIRYWLLGRKFYVHGMFHRIGGQTFISRAYYRFIGKVATKCFVYSRKGAEVLLGLGVDYKKIHIIGMAIDEKKSIKMLEKINESNLAKFITENNLLGKKVALQVVRLSRIKKPDLVLEVAKKIATSHPDLVFILIGGGELYDEMCAKVVNSNLQDSVKLLGPLYDEEKLSYWFKVANVFIMPTCIGLSAHHAFSYGLPIVTDDNLLEQASEFDILADGLNARLYKAGDMDSFKDAVLSIIDTESLQEFMSKNAFQSVNSINSLDSKCIRYLKAID